MAGQADSRFERTEIVSDRLAEIFQHANEAIFLVDPDGDQILEENAKACRLLGYSRGELLRMPVSAVHPDEMPQLIAFARSERSSRSVWTDQLSCVSKNGERIPAEFSAQIVRAEVFNTQRGSVITDFHGLEIAPKIKLVRNVSYCCGRCNKAAETLFQADELGSIIAVKPYLLAMVKLSYSNPINTITHYN